jgi:hypothetical protein
MLEASITFSSFDREEAAGGGAENVAESLTGGNFVTSGDEPIFGECDNGDNGRELGFPHIKKDTGRSDGNVVVLGIGCCLGIPGDEGY